MQTKITLTNLMSATRSHQRPALATGLALLSMVLVLAYSGPESRPWGAVTLASASPTQPFAPSGQSGPGVVSPSAMVAGGSASTAAAAPTSSFGASSLQPQEPKGIFKRSFAGLGCLGVYDKAKFARLDRVCEECYTLYREPDIHSSCRQDCFRNSVFTRCVDALLLSHEAKKFDEMVDELYGK